MIFKSFSFRFAFQIVNCYCLHGLFTIAPNLKYTP